jgi:hypothetical protein
MGNIEKERINENLEFKPKNILNLSGISLDKPIYRVYPIERLVQMFIEKKNTLVKPKMWDDPFENFFLTQTFIPYGEFGDFRDSFYGQCWTLNSKESDALWRIYSHNKNGVRIKTTIYKLFYSFYNPKDSFASVSQFIGKIKYYPEKTIKNDYEKEFENIHSDPQVITNLAIQSLLTKRIEFKHENEVRLLYTDSDIYNRKEYLKKDIYQYRFEPLNIVDEILFDPRFDNTLYNIFKEKMVTLGFNVNKIKKSKLYQFPKLKLILDI